MISTIKKPVSILLILIAAVLILVSSNINRWKHIILADAKGYYAYLPAVFIYKDLNFGFFDRIEKEKYYNKDLYYDYRTGHNNNILNKYYCGTSLAISPFFLTAHILSAALNFDTDGYSEIYAKSVALAAIFYCLLGLFYLSKTLRLYSISEKNIAFVLLLVVFGTNLFYYTTREPGLSHVYSFAFVCVFVYFIKRWFYSYRNPYLIFSALALGMIILVRPINILVIFSIPFLAGNKKELTRFIKHLTGNIPLMLSCILLCCSIVSLQFIIYKIQSGYFFVYSYGEEGFNFLNPQLFNILFSYKKGLFLYTPLYLVSLLGLVYFFRKSRFLFISHLLFFVLITYVFSSWWNWWYGGSFSSRVYVEYLIFFMIPLAFALEKIKTGIKKKSFIFLLVLITVLCQVQTYQYRYYRIHWENMTKEKYWDLFFPSGRKTTSVRNISQVNLYCVPTELT